MDAAMDAIPMNPDSKAPVDLLGRQEIVDRIMKILSVISENKSSCTFALNGAWGTGKTFVLNMLMNQLWEYHSDQYIVFHYNCWQYDYYEEPLIAIVAAMLDSVDEENHLLPAHLRDKAKAGMEIAKPILKKIATDFVKNKIGVDLTDVVSNVKDYQDALDSEAQKKADSRSFDEFHSFKKAIQQAQGEIRKLTKDRTLVVVVDELDRCLPSYAIKVLERLHHLFVDVENTAVLLAVDKEQLNKTISNIFGSETNTTKYLHKFINFELQLDNGCIQTNILDKYQPYFSFFDINLLNADFPYNDYIMVLLSDLPIRTQERIIDRLITINSLFFGDTKKDYSFMCFELTWAVFHEKGKTCRTSRILKSRDSNMEYASIISGCQLNENLEVFIDNFWSTDYFHVIPLQDSHYCYLQGTSKGYIQMALLCYISWIHTEIPKFAIYHYETDLFNILEQNFPEIEKFSELYSIIA